MSNWIEVAIEKNYITLFQHDSFQDWKVIGRGGFGTIYSAYSKDAEKTVALKCLHYGFTNDNGNEFIQESEHDTFLSEQNIITNDQYTIPSNLDIVSSEKDIIPNCQDMIPSNLDIVSSEQDMGLHEQGVIQSDQVIVLNEKEHNTTNIPKNHIVELDFRCVVALDIGARFSGFAYSNAINPEIITNDTKKYIKKLYIISDNFNIRPEQAGVFKTNTVLAYDDNLQLVAWGYPALAQEPPKKRKALYKPQPKPVELFMLHLADIEEVDKPSLPPGLDAEKAITDYLHEMNKLILETLNSRWPGIRYPQKVLCILPVPAEWSHKAKETMKKCEAAVIYCMETLNEHRLSVGSSFLIVDCGRNTVNLTTRTLLPGMKYGEITERSGDLCGGSYVDREFHQFLVKFSFNGNPNEYTPKELDIERICPGLMQYVTGQAKEQMEESEWLIELDFQTVKEMFDPVVKKIIEIIQKHCASTERRCAAMLLIGGFSNSQYLQDQIRRQFATQIPIITAPKHPIAAIERGALMYGLNSLKKVLKFCHGIEINEKWEKHDPPERRTSLGHISRFKRLALRGVEVCVGQKFYYIHTVDSNQTEMMVNVFITPDNNAEYCDEYGMVMMGKIKIDISDSQKKKKLRFTLKKRVVEVEIILTIGIEKVIITAINKKTGQFYKAF
ncbi:1265_t:CDS:10, partial [Gigaspora margarita]